jgi:ribosomal protein S18 acetylase RimI-like enzyme
VSLSARRLVATDVRAYQALRLEGLIAAPESFGSSLAEEGDRPESFWIDRLERSHMYGLFDGEQLVGTAGFHIEVNVKSRHRGHVVGVYLTPAARGKGGASLLLATLIEEARRHVLQLHLVVTQSNDKARRLYERHGFAIYGEDPRGINVDGVFFDDYLMVLRLDQGQPESDRQ